MTTWNLFTVVRYCTADALKRHERVNAFNLVVSIIIVSPMLVVVVGEESIADTEA